MPRRYRSVFNRETIFGIKTDEHHSRSHSPGNHIESQVHQRPFKPVREFLTTQPLLVNQEGDNQRRSSPRINGFTRSQTEATIQNVNIALTQTANKLRQEPFNSGIPITRSLPTLTEPFSTRPMTVRSTKYQNTGTTTSINYDHQTSNETKKPLPIELTMKRSTNFFTSPSNSQDRIATGPGPLIVQRSTAMATNEHTNARIPTPLRALPHNLELDNEPVNFGKAVLDDYPKKTKTNKTETNHPKVKSRKQSPTQHASSIDKHHRALPEVSVHPQFQSSVQENLHHLPTIHDEIHTNHRRTQIDTNDNTKRISSSSRKSLQIIDVQPNVTMEHQPSNSPPPTPRRLITRKNSFNEIHLERNHIHEQGLTNSTSTLKQEDTSNGQNLLVPPSSPASRDLNNHNDNPFRMNSEILVNRRNSKHHRPSTRLKNYDDESESELTVTETQSKDDYQIHRHDQMTSDVVSDVWSDLTSEFSTTKLRKHPHIRTSTPNLTQRSSSFSSKEIVQLRKQLNNLQIMYDDLFRLLDNDTETAKVNHIKTNISSQPEPNERKHRFRKMLSIHQTSSDMKEINQRFTRLESSIVTLAESIAKLSAQVQSQRSVKNEVAHLREEVAELRQQISQPSSRLLSANVQRLATTNSTNPINMTSSTNQRSTAVLDPRQARKIEQ
ncbi:hypothetical protein I4U23_000602 [Adineta vaga]|nr:hypothetical protein I4U23_000602 [Adineta vaga]